MRQLIYSMGVSLDGFIAGPDGEIDWSAPDEELHRFHNQQAGGGTPYFPALGPEDQPGAGRDTHVWLSRRLRSLPACGVRRHCRRAGGRRSSRGSLSRLCRRTREERRPPARPPRRPGCQRAVGHLTGCG